MVVDEVVAVEFIAPGLDGVENRIRLDDNGWSGPIPAMNKWLNEHYTYETMVYGKGYVPSAMLALASAMVKHKRWEIIETHTRKAEVPDGPVEY